MNEKIFERVCGRDGVKSGLLLDAMSNWVCGLAEWQVIAHLTFPWEASLNSARRCHDRFMSRSHPDLDYFYAEEKNPSRPGYHIHELLYRPMGILCKGLWSDWFEKYGRCRFELIRSMDDVTGYCAKYVLKEQAWWNVRIVRRPDSSAMRFSDGGGLFDVSGGGGERREAEK